MPHILGLLLNILKNMNSVNDKMPHQTVTHNRNTFAHILNLILFSVQAWMMIWKDRRASKWLILLTCGRLRWPNMKREIVKHISACWWQKKTSWKHFLNSVSEEKLQEGESGRFSPSSSGFCIFPHNMNRMQDDFSTNMGDAISWIYDWWRWWTTKRNL